MAPKGLVASIIKFLTSQLDDGNITPDSRESLEVAIQCLESAYGVQAKDAPVNFNLLNVYKATAVENPLSIPEASEEAKAEAEKLKNEGNLLMKAEKFQEALNNYTKAIQLDGRNAIFYCNRAAVHSKIGNPQEAVKDCHTALSIDPAYSKAYGRLGLAYSSLDRHKEAKESYQKAVELEPDNESYKNNLQLAEEKLAQQGTSNVGIGGGNAGIPNMDFGALLNNPTLMNMTRQMLSHPGMQNMMGNLMSGNVEQGGQMDTLIEIGQQLAQHMQTSNPELVETVRRQIEETMNDPEPSQKNN